HDEKITPKFMSLVKCTKNDDSLGDIGQDDGSAFLNDEDRERFILNSYKKIYEIPRDIGDQNRSIEDFLGQNVLNNEIVQGSILTELEKQDLEGQLTLAELDESVKKAKSKSAPGADGISNAFIKKFWTFFRVPLYNVINGSFERNSLPNSFRSANIKLIPKKGNTKLLKNWRPISLLNCFYKIVSRVFGNRLKRYMDKLTPIGQKGHSKTRRCQEVLLNLIETIDECKIKGIKGCILSLDIKKAFDCVSHAFVEKTLRFFNFGENMVKWLLLLSTNRRACIVLDGKRTTDFFPLDRGNAQGDIISPFIFNLCYQIMLFKINYDERIKGVLTHNFQEGDQQEQQVTQNVVKILAMADDANCLLQMEYETLFLTKSILEEYRLISGFECNIEKTLLIPIGLTEAIPENIQTLGFDIKISGKIVGMDISNDMGDFQRVVDGILLKMDNVIRDFQRFNLSLPGRINVAKTFLYSQLNYLGSFLPFTARQIESLNNKIANFARGKLNISNKRVFLSN
ncbi:MAG: reverse transcriptase family protein, partial [Sphingomonadales bacterium]|nr:reverse transcriptase family protein [Sphingomonadales bacterium]